jgi:isopentenyldiphosphate isomerase
MRPAKGTQQRQKEDEQEHEHKHMDDHEAFSLFEMSRWDRLLLRRKNKDRREGLSSG